MGMQNSKAILEEVAVSCQVKHRLTLTLGRTQPGASGSTPCIFQNSELYTSNLCTILNLNFTAMKAKQKSKIT